MFRGAVKGNPEALAFIALDLLYVGREDLRRRPLLERLCAGCPAIGPNFAEALDLGPIFAGRPFQSSRPLL